MNRLDAIFTNLGYNRDNGLFFTAEADVWIDKFPYRIGRVLKDIIRPYAFYSPFFGLASPGDNHPEPLNNPIILFFYNPDAEIEQHIPRWAFNFSQAPVVIIYREDSSTLDIFHGYHFDGRNQQWLKKIDSSDAVMEDFKIESLVSGKIWEKLYKKYFKDVPKVDKYLLQNITDARRILIAKDTGGLSPTTANRLIGRLLFIRYLIDRNVTFEDERFIRGDTKIERQKCLEQLLASKEKTYAFFKYITGSFNGDLFPLVESRDGDIIYDEEKVVKKEHLEVLYHLFVCSEFFCGQGNYKGYTVQKSLFNLYDFEVIPVELISNIYENFLKETGIESLDKLDNSQRKEVQAYYTPPFLVDYILSQTVTPHLENVKTTSCKVLDPACGSGIFLVETLRKLIEKEMALNPGVDGKRSLPDHRLWQLVHDNIFGIDIDSGAIEITIFSIYITILEYKTPKEISSFRFRKLKDKNLFGGETADFFNENHPFNNILKDNQLDFIIGNPPWGVIKNSIYKDYIKDRKNRERKSGDIPLQITNAEISQAFMVRSSDFCHAEKKTKCVFIVTVKNFYNSQAKKWRDYFLNSFCISKIFDLTAISNKIKGGPKVFDGAKYPAAVVSFHPKEKDEAPGKNVITFITARDNYYWECFKTIVIDGQDIKRVFQEHFMENLGGEDWLWNVLRHGNLLDFCFISRLKEEFNTLQWFMKEMQLVSMRGLQPKFNSSDRHEKVDMSLFLDWDYLEIDKRKEFASFSLTPRAKWKEKKDELIAAGKIGGDGKIGRLPDIHFFSGKKLLIKRGLQMKNNFKAAAAFSEANLLFSDSVISIKPDKNVPFTDEMETVLKTAAGVFNSNLFSYFLLSTGTSFEVDRGRADKDEFCALPLMVSKKIRSKVEEIQALHNPIKKVFLERAGDTLAPGQKEQLFKELETIIHEEYNLSAKEKALLDYAIEVAIPILKKDGFTEGVSTPIYDRLSLSDKEDNDYLAGYADVFSEHFGQRFDSVRKYFVVDIHVNDFFIGCHFKITEKPANGERLFFFGSTDEREMIKKIGNLGYGVLSKDLYIRQDIRGFNKSSFYVIKPNQRRLWHKAIAYADLSEFIQALVKAEIKKRIA